MKRKYTRGNEMLFMIKKLFKKTKTRPRLRKKFLKSITEENKTRYTKQRNKCVSLSRSAKMKYYGNLDERKL